MSLSSPPASKELDFPEDSQTTIPELPVSKSVIEILQVILYNSIAAEVSVSIKSTRTLTSLTEGLWFYIKVSADSSINFDLFKDVSSTPYLFKLLRTMQQVESESHLCIQNCVGEETCQQNLVVQGTSLVIQHKSTKQKQINASSLHLRVHQTQSDMMRESHLIYKFMQIIKIFRPRVSLHFTVKMGENLCRSNYRVSDWTSVCPGILEIVSDSTFYLHKSNYTPEQDHVKASYTGPVTVSVRITESVERLDITSVGVYIPVVAQKDIASIITLTLLGPGRFPLEILDIPEATILSDLNLSLLGLKVVTPVSDSRGMTTASDLPTYQWKLYVQSTNKNVAMSGFVLQLFLLIEPTENNHVARKGFCFVQNHLSNIIVKIGDKLSSTVRETLHKALQSWLEKEKTRTMIYKSIRSVGKAIRDIVSMSNRETFRQDVFQQMQVDNTMELEKKVQSNLMDMSRRKHAGVWNSFEMDSKENINKETTAQSLTNNEDLRNMPISNMPRSPISDSQPVCISKSGMSRNTVNEEIKENQKSPKIKTQSDYQNKTPELSGNPKSDDGVSPFQQLADALICTVDNLSGEDKVGRERLEEPYEFGSSEEEIMAKLFNEEDSDIVNSEEAFDMIGSQSMAHCNLNIFKDIHMEQLLEISPFIPPGHTSVFIPEIAAHKKDAVLKRSASFPKDLDHQKERSAKFCRALSGDRIVPQFVCQQLDHNEDDTELTAFTHSSQLHLYQPSFKTTQTFESSSRNSSHYFPMYNTADISGITLPKCSLPKSELLDNKPEEIKTTDAEDKQLASELAETFDVVSKFVDDYVDKEVIDNIDGYLNSCHIQSQVIATEADRNNNNKISADEFNSTFADRISSDKVSERLQDDSDDWFDDAIADFDNWFSTNS